MSDTEIEATLGPPPVSTQTSTEEEQLRVQKNQLRLAQGYLDAMWPSASEAASPDEVFASIKAIRPSLGIWLLSSEGYALDIEDQKRIVDADLLRLQYELTLRKNEVPLLSDAAESDYSRPRTHIMVEGKQSQDGLWFVFKATAWVKAAIPIEIRPYEFRNFDVKIWESSVYGSFLTKDADRTLRHWVERLAEDVAAGFRHAHRMTPSSKDPGGP